MAKLVGPILCSVFVLAFIGAGMFGGMSLIALKNGLVEWQLFFAKCAEFFLSIVMIIFILGAVGFNLSQLRDSERSALSRWMIAALNVGIAILYAFGVVIRSITTSNS